MPRAERDLEIGADFYEFQQPGLGVYFHDCLTSDPESLRQYAGIHENHLGFHRSISKRFPSAIYYKRDGNCINVYAVLDVRQDPHVIDASLGKLRDKP